MQTRRHSLCGLDDTWEDVLTEFTDSLKGKPTWSCFCVEGVDREVILSAPEIMDPKTDSGFGYQEVSSLQHLLDTKAIPPASSLTGEKLLDVMDFIHAKELTYLQGYSLVQSYLSFPYFLRLDILKKENPTLHAYCRGVLRTLDCVLRAVFATTIRSDEEFMMVPPELEREAECPLEEILAELDAEAARQTSPAIAARLQWRRQFLAALSLFLDAKRRSDVEAACDLCSDALAMLQKDTFQSRCAEPQVDPALLREREVAFWVSTMTPNKALPLVTFAEALAAYETLLRQLASIRQLLALQSLPSIVDFVEALGAQEPLLPVRCVAVVVLFSRDPNESFLFGLPIQQRILEMLARDYGSPLYLKIFEGDAASTESVAKYRIHKTTDPLKVTPEQLQRIRSDTVDSVRRWTSEACKHFLVRLETALCNRGLAHRRLMKGMAGLGQFQELSYGIDISIFLASQPGVAGEAEPECIRASTVLTLFANTLVLRAMEQTVQLQLELNLLSQGELLPALWYLNFAQRAQAENLSLLCLQNTSFIPETRVNKKTFLPVHNLALSTRTKGVLDPARVNVLDASRMLSDAVFLSACLMEHKGLVDLTSGAKHSLVTVEDTFNHRMMKCFGDIRSPPFTPYHRCMAAKPDFAADPAKVSMYAKRAGEVAVSAGAKMRLVLSGGAGVASASPADDATRRECLSSLYGGFERAAKVVAASLATLSAICDDVDMLGKYTASVDRSTLPYIVNFVLRKKD